MALMSVEDLYEKYIKPLPASERLRLLTLTTTGLSCGGREDESAKRSILDLEGLEAHLWQGVDAQDYVRQLRAEWG